MTRTASKPRILTVADLDRAIRDERHLGFGYATSRDISAGRRKALDLAVVEVANDLGVDYETLFVWSNSKNGRWLVDEASGIAPSRTLVLRYLNARWVAEDYAALCETARSLGIPTSLDDPSTPQTVSALREAVAQAEASR
jgi:hypothetical protein